MFNIQKVRTRNEGQRGAAHSAEGPGNRWSSQSDRVREGHGVSGKRVRDCWGSEVEGSGLRFVRFGLSLPTPIDTSEKAAAR